MCVEVVDEEEAESDQNKKVTKHKIRNLLFFQSMICYFFSHTILLYSAFFTSLFHTWFFLCVCVSFSINKFNRKKKNLYFMMCKQNKLTKQNKTKKKKPKKTVCVLYFKKITTIVQQATWCRIQSKKKKTKKKRELTMIKTWYSLRKKIIIALNSK